MVGIAMEEKLENDRGTERERDINRVKREKERKEVDTERERNKMYGIEKMEEESQQKYKGKPCENRNRKKRNKIKTQRTKRTKETNKK